MRISIVTVCRNSERTIADTIRSVRAQCFGDFEHVIVDGASTDGTLALIESLRHDQMRVISESDRGLYDAMNKGIRAATGDLIGFLNADDYFCRTDALALLARAMESNAEASAVCGRVIIVDQRDVRRILRVYTADGYGAWMLRFGHMPPHPVFYVRKNVLDEVGEFDLTNKIAADFDWMVRFFLGAEKNMIALREVLVSMRAGGISSSGWRSTLSLNREIVQTLGRHGIWSNSLIVWSKYIVKVWQLLIPRRLLSVPASVRWSPTSSSAS